MHARKIKVLQRLIYNKQQRHLASQAMPTKIASDPDYGDLYWAKFSPQILPKEVEESFSDMSVLDVTTSEYMKTSFGFCPANKDRAMKYLDFTFHILMQ